MAMFQDESLTETLCCSVCPFLIYGAL